MAIENRNLEPGTRLVAKYKGETWTVEVLPDAEARFGFVGKRPNDKAQVYRSLSAAGSAIMGGKAVNGWKFWSLEGEAKVSKDGSEHSEHKEARLGAPPKVSTKARKVRKLIYRSPNQQKVAEGSSRWFCTACMRSFVHAGEGEPEACPEGHRIDDAELTGEAGMASDSRE